MHVWVNGSTTLADGYINKFGDIVPFSGSVTLAAGGTVDFLVGYGLNGNFYGDSTGLSATITTVPEPSTWFGGAMGVLTVLAMFFRSRRG